MSFKSSFIQNQLSTLEKLLAYQFRRPELAFCAMVHASFRKEQQGYQRDLEDNEKLEFLGDTVLNLLVSETLMQRWPGFDEGQLSQMRAMIVNTRALARVAEEMQLSRWLFFGKGEGLGQKTNILADALEALIGALYQDGGLDAARHILPFLAQVIEEASIQDERPALDPKSELQELCMKTYKMLPEYKLLSKKGFAHEPLFKVSVIIQNEPWACAEGKSLKAAQKMAAAEALVLIKKKLNAG